MGFSIYDPATHRRFNTEQGIDDAFHLLSYYSRVIHRGDSTFQALPTLQKQVFVDIGGRYEQFLRYPWGGPPADATAETPAQEERSDDVRSKTINTVLRDMAHQAQEVPRQRVSRWSWQKRRKQNRHLRVRRYQLKLRRRSHHQSICRAAPTQRWR